STRHSTSRAAASRRNSELEVSQVSSTTPVGQIAAYNTVSRLPQIVAFSQAPRRTNSSTEDGSGSLGIFVTEFHRRRVCAARSDSLTTGSPASDIGSTVQP